ncbi:MAG: long-chain fatty acid--CoA ligase [Bacteroidales bacterium]|nr:long-chain fatty acid--CoA ligase [Bacteroidales bacterium]
MKQHLAHLLKHRMEKYGSQDFYRYKNNNNGTYDSMSWEQVHLESKRVSKALLSMGFGFESNIGIFSNNRPEWSITDYGILAIRSVVVPFFGTASKDQLKYISDETQMKILFVGDEEQFEKAFWLLNQSDTLENLVYFGDSISSDDARCMNFEDFKKLGDLAKFDLHYDETFEKAGPDDLATIIYTSGTTGEPKGVMLTHDNFMYCFGLHDQRLDVTDKDVSMSFLPLSHVFERTWSFYMMHCGAVNVFLENPKTVINELPLANPTLMCTVPRFFEKTHEGILAEYEKWPGIKKRIFDWSIATGHKLSELKSQNKEPGLTLKLKYKFSDALVLQKLRKIFGNNMRTMPCSGAAIRPDLLRFFHATGLFINYGYGATETTATVACYKTSEYEFESCGTIMPEIEVGIDGTREIKVKGRTVFKGYYKKPKETEAVLIDGWYYTGDEGYLSSKNNLVMTDRMRDLFKTSGGKYVSPQKVELLLGQDKYIEQIITFGDNRKYITALIVPAMEALKWKATQLGIPTDVEKMISHEEINLFIQKRIDLLQEALASYERVVKFRLLKEPFSIENKGLTSTLKLKRRIIAEQFKDLIESMY